MVPKPQSTTHVPGFSKDANGNTVYFEEHLLAKIFLLLGIIFCFLPCVCCLGPCFLIAAFYITTVKITFEQNQHTIVVSKVKSMFPGTVLETKRIHYNNVKDIISELDPNTRINEQATYIVKAELFTGEKIALSSNVVNPQEIIEAMKQEIAKPDVV